MSSRGDSTINVILFITIVIAGLILTTWYSSSVQPTRYNIGSVTEDLTEIQQHLTNACSSTIYRGTYRMATTGLLKTNVTHICLETPSFASCRLIPCAVEGFRMNLEQDAILHIEKESDLITLST